MTSERRKVFGLFKRAVCVLLMLVASRAHATSTVPFTMTEQIQFAHVIAHITPTSIKLFENDGVNCGYMYEAEVHDVLKGQRASEVAFFSSFRADNLAIGEDAIVFFVASTMWADLDGAYSLFPFDSEYEMQHKKSCGELAPRLTDVGAMPYTVAREDPFDDEVLEETSDQSKIRAWYDERLMVRIPSNIVTPTINNIRVVSVNSVSVNGETTRLSEIESRWLIPHWLGQSVVLAPAREIKSYIRDVVRDE